MRGLRIAPGREERTASAIATIARADSDSGSASTTGTPASPASRSAVSSGTVPSSGTPRSSASFAAAASFPKVVPAHVLDDAEDFWSVFCGTSRRGRPPRARPAAASSRPAPVAGKQLPERDRDVARARRRIEDDVSSAPQGTSYRNCSSAPWSIGPRQMTAALSSRKKPMDISLSPPRTGGTIVLSTRRAPVTPSMGGIEWP